MKNVLPGVQLLLTDAVILNESFLRYFDGLVIRPFLLGTIGQCWTKPLFMAHARPSEIELLGTYLRSLTLANAYRDKAEYFKLSAKPQQSRDWLEPLLLVWKDNLEQCQKSIEEVIELIDS